jgi:uncharacterized lipoprotein
MKKIVLFILFIFMISGCTIDWHQKPTKFQIYPEVMKSFKSDVPINIIKILIRKIRTKRP